jgi:TetR/AcrR family transcriptional regulator, transcriptional repressor for nem operon
MPHPIGKKEAGRAKILVSAGRGFRRYGFGGVGIDGLAKEAGVTSGAFYAHFKSKAEAFRAAVNAGLEDLKLAIPEFQERFGKNWRTRFVEFYLGERRTCELGESCGLQSLSADVSRADNETRAEFERRFQGILDAVASGLEGRPRVRRQDAIAMLALLAGGVTLARAVKNPALAEEIANAVRKAADPSSSHSS